ncbi:hypothetical protein [Streptomyces liangshanensis]|uniref:Uncharacterized protein n=1 Tax=Streptomyces liangshanensis TaxID=2717324 RepID=A0A6G9GXM9_9ACTN|nr:hypothetical protein [Streptomyces liangshanensis]QIQ02970.1 hypothetical protein HA039_12085 [Streptomyces liangshanensis]
MYATQAVTHVVLAAELDENKVTPGVLGFVVFAVMAAGLWWLMKSMNRHMGKVDFKEAPEPPARATATAGTPTDRVPGRASTPGKN